MRSLFFLSCLIFSTQVVAQSEVENFYSDLIVDEQAKKEKESETAVMKAGDILRQQPRFVKRQDIKAPTIEESKKRLEKRRSLQ